MNKIELHPLIENRYSAVAFSNKAIDNDIVESLFKAASKAPSSYNDQPWRFVYAKKGEKQFDQLAELLSDTNKLWAPEAAVFVMCIARKTLSKNEKDNRHGFHDLGLAVANLTFQANHMGLFLHQMGGFDYERAQQEFSIPSNYEPQSILAIGYPGDVDSLEGIALAKAKAPRLRKEMQDIAFHGEWKES